MSKSPFRPKLNKENAIGTDLYYEDISSNNLDEEYKSKVISEKTNDKEKKPAQINEYEKHSSMKRNLNDNSNENTKPDIEIFLKLKETEEYQVQLSNLEQKISLLKNDLQDQTIKNSDLEKKLKELQLSDGIIQTANENNQENVRKVQQFEILLKESRKQNLIYSDEIKEFKKKEFNLNKANEEIDYLKHENLTLKAFMVAQNKMTHYRHAFENLKIENYCPRCSESIQQEILKSSQSDQSVQCQDSEKDMQVPGLNKSGHRNVVELLKRSSPYTIHLTNNGNNSESVDTKNCKSQKEVMPSINKTVLKQMSEKLDVSLDAMDALARTVIHLGDQLLIRVDWEKDKECRSTVKYIGNLDERYQHRLFIGVKLSIKINEIPQEYRSNGWFRNRQFFSIKSDTGYFLHFSNVVAIYNKETVQFEDFGDYLHRKIDPKANRSSRKIRTIKGLIEK